MVNPGARYKYHWTGGETDSNDKFCSGSRLVLHHREQNNFDFEFCQGSVNPDSRMYCQAHVQLLQLCCKVHTSQRVKRSLYQIVYIYA